MHDIEPFYNWLKYYDSSQDEKSPFFGKEYNYDLYQDTVYGFFIDPGWDSIDSETLYLKTIYADYEEGFAIIEFIGEWNDAINNDIMLLKRNFIELLSREGITKFILLGENILNFHGSDDAYYEEWHDEVEDSENIRTGWIAAVNFPDFIREEFEKYKIDRHINMGGSLQIDNWRTLHPLRFYQRVDSLVQRKLN
jgi:hypothetical protein